MNALEKEVQEMIEKAVNKKTAELRARLEAADALAARIETNIAEERCDNGGRGCPVLVDLASALAAYKAAKDEQ